LSLDPTSKNYIAKIIGDKYTYYDDTTLNRVVSTGDYDNRSKYIRVSISDDVANNAIDPSAMPIGFRAPYSTINSNIKCTVSVYNNTGSAKQYLGWNYSSTDALQFIGPIAYSSSV